MKLLMMFLFLFSTVALADSSSTDGVKEVESQTKAKLNVYWYYSGSPVAVTNPLRNIAQNYYRVRKNKVAVSLNYKEWGEGKIRGYVELAGTKKCETSKRFNFVGVDRGLGEFEIFENAEDVILNKRSLGTIIEFNKKVQLNLEGNGRSFLGTNTKGEYCMVEIEPLTSLVFKI